MNYKFEAENAGGNGWDVLSKDANEAASGGTCVGHVYDVSLSAPGQYYLLFEVYAAADTDATLYIGVSAAEAINTKAFPITVNDEDKTVDKGIAKTSWNDFVEVEYTAVSLKKGKNTVKMTIGEAAIGNIDFIGFASQVEITGAPEA